MKPRSTTILCLAALAALFFGPGCSKTGQWHPLDIQVLPKSPEQVALDAFNMYDADKRRDAVETLAAADFGGEAPYVRTYRMLIDDPDPTVRGAAVKALARHGDLSDAPLFLRLLQEDEFAFVRWQSAVALQRLHMPESAEPLSVAMLKDEDVDTRAAAAEALGQYPQREVFAALVGALDDRDFSVVAAANKSLKTLTGYDFGSDGSLWLIWAKRNEGDLFAHQQTYTYRPFFTPESKLKFWSKPDQPEPRKPLGIEEADASAQTAKAGN